MQPAPSTAGARWDRETPGPPVHRLRGPVRAPRRVVAVRGPQAPAVLRRGGARAPAGPAGGGVAEARPRAGQPALRLGVVAGGPADLTGPGPPARSVPGARPGSGVEPPAVDDPEELADGPRRCGRSRCPEGVEAMR